MTVPVADILTQARLVRYDQDPSNLLSSWAFASVLRSGRSKICQLCFGIRKSKKATYRIRRGAPSGGLRPSSSTSLPWYSLGAPAGDSSSLRRTPHHTVERIWAELANYSRKLIPNDTHSFILACITSNGRALSPFFWTASWKNVARATLLDLVNRLAIPSQWTYEYERSGWSLFRLAPAIFSRRSSRICAL